MSPKYQTWQLQQQSRTRYVPPYNVAMIYAALNEKIMR
jgi:hypothetical protein